MSDRIFVAGATGKQGGAVANHLLKNGFKVRAFTRHPEKAEHLRRMGAEVVKGDLTDRESVENALKGIKRMYLVTNPYEFGMDAEVKQGITAVDAARNAGIEYLVYSSVGSAHRNTGIPHFETKWQIEQHIRELGLQATILRPVFFMDNFQAPWLFQMLQQGTLAIPMAPDRKLAMIAVDNIGAYVADAFARPEKYMGYEIELAGDEITFPKAVDLISKVSGRRILYREMPLAEAEKVFGHETTAMYIWFDKVGYIHDIPLLKKEYGIPLQNFPDYLETASWVEKLRNKVRAT